MSDPREAIAAAKKAKAWAKRREDKLFNEPPNKRPTGKFAAEKCDDRYARNALLNYIEEKGLTDDLAEWMEANLPSLHEREGDAWSLD
jgi:hypothetical protein